jgi:hypothetical protein
MDKAAFGLATGCAAALVAFLVTAITIARGSRGAPDLMLLNQYFAGYTITWTGAVIGAAWAAFTGFVMGWFLAFSRNLCVAVLVTVIRTRAELAQARDFLDHI